MVQGNSFGEVKLGRGVDSNTTFLMKHSEVAQELEDLIKGKMV